MRLELTPYAGDAHYDSKTKIIVLAWINDSSKSDPYAVFEKMLGRGNPSDDWAALVAVAASRTGWSGPAQRR